METRDLKESIMKLHIFTVPQIQHDFNVSYGEAKQCVDELLQDEFIRPLNKLKYVVRQRRRRVILQRETLQNMRSDVERIEVTNMDAGIVVRFPYMKQATCNELRNILRSTVPEGLPVTENIQKALDVVTFFAQKNIHLILRGVQVGQEKFRCIYYAPNRANDPIVKDTIQMYRHESKGRVRMRVVYKYLSFGLFVLDFPFYEALPAFGKQVAKMLVDKKIPRYELSTIRQKYDFNVADYYRSIFRMEHLGVLNEHPAPHGSVAYRFAVDAKYFDCLLPDYLWRGKIDKTKEGK